MSDIAKSPRRKAGKLGKLVPVKRQLASPSDGKPAVRKSPKKSFPNPGDLKCRVTADPHKIYFVDASGKKRSVSISKLESAAYAVHGNCKAPPGQRTMSGYWPEIILLDGTIVLDSNAGIVIGGTDVAVAQATGSALQIDISNAGDPAEVQRFTFVSGISASARLRSGGSVETTTTVGEYIEVTFDNLGQPILGTWQ